MADRLYGDVVADTTGMSLEVLLRSTVDNAPVTSVAFSGVTAARYYRQGAASTVPITLATLAANNSAWASGGWREIDGTNYPGRYRFDIPDAAFASGADWVGVQVRVNGAFNFDAQFTLQSAALIPDQILKRDFSAVTGEAARSMLNALRFLRNRWAVTPSTLSVHKEVDTTVAWIGSVSTATGAAAITSVDPA